MFSELAAMEASPLLTSSEDWAEQFDQSLHLQRERIREFLDAQQQRLERAETELGLQLRQFADEVARNRGDVRQAEEEVQQRSERLTREAQTLESLKEELATRQAAWEQFQQRATHQQEAWAEQAQQHQDQLDRLREELAQRQSEIDAAEAKLHHDQQALDLARQEHQAGCEQVAALREQLEAKRAELDTRHEQLSARQADTESQRRRIARELKARHAEQLKELERRRSELHRRDAHQHEELQQQLASAREQQAAVAAELNTSRQRAQELDAELGSLRGKYDQLTQEQTQRPGDGGMDAEQLKRVEAERDALLTRLGETENRLAEAQRSLAGAKKAGAEGEPADADARRRYEMVLEDLRELKAQNAELQRQLAQAQSARPAAQSPGGTLDWEAQKRRLLAALEADSDQDSEEAKAERLKIEDVIGQTDRVLAEKDRECRELKQLLENQSANLGTVAVGAAALGEVLDSDAIVQEEREKLKQLQEQWREKLRQAEVDISIERAKLAREKAQIEEKLLAVEKGAHQPEGKTGAGVPACGSPAAKPARGRWRERLGLKEPEEGERKR
jgi:chromosome segregation ATPase